MPLTLCFTLLLAGTLEVPPPSIGDAGATDTDAELPTDAGVDAGTQDAPSPDPSPASGRDAAPVIDTIALKGRVIEKGTRKPLGNAALTIDGIPAGDTDAGGAFERNVRPGPHHVQVQLPGYEVVDRVVIAQPGAPEEVIRLPAQLTGERYESTVHIGHPEYPQVALAAEEARTVAGSSGDPLRVLASLPGVSQVAWPAALYVVRGANPGNTGFYLDGIRVPALFHLALGPSVIHPYLIGGVDFYPGAFPAAFGGYVSGIVATHTTSPPSDRVHASADVTLFDAGGIVTAPFHDQQGTIAAAARYSYTGALFSWLSVDSVLRYGDYQIRIDHPLGAGQATVLAFGSLDELGYPDPNTANDIYARLQFHRVDGRWRAVVAGGRLLVGATLGVDWSQSTLFDRPIKMRGLSVAPRITFDRPLGSLVDLQVGTDGNAQSFAADVPNFQRRPSDLARSRRAFTQGVHATVALHWGRLTVAPGLRGDLFAEESTTVHAVQPRLSVLYRLNETVDLKADAGRFAQMPSLPISVPGFEAFGLADLGLQTALGGSAGVEMRLPRTLTLSLTGYHKRLRLTDIRDLDPARADLGAPDFLVSREGRAYGTELLLRRANQGRVFGWLAYTLSRSLRRDDRGALGVSDWDQRHIVNLVAGYRARGGYSFGARIHYNTGRQAPIANSGGDYRRLPDFYQLDLRAERRFVFDRFLLDLYADIANATFTPEVVQLTATRNPTTGGLVTHEDALHLILPTVGLHGEF